ncbi:MAG: PIN domain-containing protein [Actinobacteria bacterium]|nr:PIN domain-containing protein [Actinomycetota bacterium]
MAFVVDSSAIVKLIVDEPNSQNFGNWLKNCKSELFVSEIAHTEVARAIARVDANLHRQLKTVLERFGIIRVSSQILAIASVLAPTKLRTLDAIHLASCLILGDDLDGLVTYDDSQTDAAQQEGITVVAP